MECSIFESKNIQYLECWILESENIQYRIMPNKRTPPNKRPLLSFMIAYYKRLKERSEAIKEIDAKKQ